MFRAYKLMYISVIKFGAFEFITSVSSTYAYTHFVLYLLQTNIFLEWHLDSKYYYLQSIALIYFAKYSRARKTMFENESKNGKRYAETFWREIPKKR